MTDKRIAEPGQRLKEALELRHMRAADLSRKCDINKSRLSCYMSGTYDPKPEALHVMSRALQVNELWLAGYDEPMERPQDQDNADAIAEAVVRFRQDPDFLQLTEKLLRLEPQQLLLISQLADQFSGASIANK